MATKEEIDTARQRYASDLAAYKALDPKETHEIALLETVVAGLDALEREALLREWWRDWAHEMTTTMEGELRSLLDSKDGTP